MCWHKWTKWDEPEIRKISGGGGKDGRGTLVQTRRCEKCNLVQMKVVTEPRE